MKRNACLEKIITTYLYDGRSAESISSLYQGKLECFSANSNAQTQAVKYLGSHLVSGNCVILL